MSDKSEGRIKWNWKFSKTLTINRIEKFGRTLARARFVSPHLSLPPCCIFLSKFESEVVRCLSRLSFAAVRLKLLDFPLEEYVGLSEFFPFENLNVKYCLICGKLRFVIILDISHGIK